MTDTGGSSTSKNGTNVFRTPYYTPSGVTNRNPVTVNTPNTTAAAASKAPAPTPSVSQAVAAATSAIKPTTTTTKTPVSTGATPGVSAGAAAVKPAPTPTYTAPTYASTQSNLANQLLASSKVASAAANKIADSAKARNTSNASAKLKATATAPTTPNTATIKGAVKPSKLTGKLMSRFPKHSNNDDDENNMSPWDWNGNNPANIAPTFQTNLGNRENGNKSISKIT